MDLMIRLQVYVVSFCILFIIYIQLKEEAQVYSVQDQLFKYLVLSTMCSLVFEAVSWCSNGNPGRVAYIFNVGSNSLLIMFNLMPLAMWTLYVMSAVNENKKSLIQGFMPMGILMVINMLLALSAPVNKKYFYIDENNLYHRGEWAIVAITIYGFLFMYSLFVILYNWKKINQRNRVPMLLFLLPPIIGFTLQMMFYGTSWLWPGATISILMVYIQVQSQVVKIDYLTGLYNRRELDFYLERKIKNLPVNRKFAGVMIDIDEFKFINDQYGHAVGDKAIKTAAAIIKKSFRKDEFAARYGGDEFVVLFDIKDEIELYSHVANLRNQFDLFNQKKEEVFELKVSVGFSTYALQDNQGRKFIERLDYLMYEDKSLRESKRKKLQMYR